LKKKLVLFSVGELIKRKNHETVIRAIARLKETDPALADGLYYVIAGRGVLQEYLTHLIHELHVESQVKLLGFRKDIDHLDQAADIFVMPSFQEGLSVALMEAMGSGLPCIVSAIRGNTDLIDEHGGQVFDPHSVEECEKAIRAMMKKTDNDRERMGACNREKIVGEFGIRRVEEIMRRIYTDRRVG